MWRANAVALAVLGVILAQTATAADDSLSDERVEASYNSGTAFVHHAGLDAYLRQVVHRLQAANSDAPAGSLRIHVLSNDLPYAFILGNGAGYITTGLLERLDDEQQLAAIIAMSLAPLVRRDQQTLTAENRQRMLRNFLPNLLVITATAGLGAPMMAKADTKARAEREDQAQTASDAVALHWLASVGYQPRAGPAALRRLRELLLTEQRAGSNDLSDLEHLAARADRLDQSDAVNETPVEGAPIDPAGSFDRFSLYFALNQAAADLDGHAVSVVPILDRVEARRGETGYTAYLRAELLRRDSADASSVPVAIAAYEKCVSHADAPESCFRELGLLYRRSGDSARARESFLAYLAHAPKAADAPIIRTYLENP